MFVCGGSIGGWEALRGRRVFAANAPQETGGEALWTPSGVRIESGSSRSMDSRTAARLGLRVTQFPVDRPCISAPGGVDAIAIRLSRCCSNVISGSLANRAAYELIASRKTLISSWACSSTGVWNDFDFISYPQCKEPMVPRTEASRRLLVARGGNKLDGGVSNYFRRLTAVNGTFVPGATSDCLAATNVLRGRRLWWPAVPPTAPPAPGGRRFRREFLEEKRADRGKRAPTDPPRSKPLPKFLFRF
jgi:hypothetical protein